MTTLHGLHSIRLACLSLILVFGTSPTSAAPLAEETGPVVAVADFSGPDKELGRFIADTLLTDLAQSNRLRMTERAELRQALAELKLQSTGLVEPQQVKRLGKLVGADCLIVGGYLARENQLLINARLLDVRTGRVTPGGAASVSGPRSELFGLAHRLAFLLHKRITREELALTEDSRPYVPPTAPAKPQVAASSPPESRRLQASALLPPGQRPSNVVTEYELARIVDRLAPPNAPASRRLSGRSPDIIVNRLRAFVALVKAVLPPEEVAAYENGRVGSRPPDAGKVPLWGQVYVVAAVERGWWSADRLLRPTESASWGFVGHLLEQILPTLDTPAPKPRREITLAQRPGQPSALNLDNEPPKRLSPPEEPVAPDAFTGLIIDARGLRVERAMCLRILDESGRVVYPDSRYLPDDEFLMDQGLAAYLSRVEEGTRAGGRPLIVRARSLSPTAREDLIVSNQIAERIREENRRGRFLHTWKVCILVNSR